MRVTNLFPIAIYEENKLFKDLLHNKLEYFGYEISSSSSYPQELLRNLETPPCVLISCVGNAISFVKAIKKVHKVYPTTKFLFYTDRESFKMPFLKPANYVIAGSSFRLLVSQLEKLLPEHPIHKNNCAINGHNSLAKLSPIDPFYAVISNSTKYEILRLAAKGKSTKQMVPIINLKYNHIDTYRKQIIHETNCNNLIEVVAKAKDLRLI